VTDSLILSIFIRPLGLVRLVSQIMHNLSCLLLDYVSQMMKIYFLKLIV